MSRPQLSEQRPLINIACLQQERHNTHPTIIPPSPRNPKQIYDSTVTCNSGPATNCEAKISQQTKDQNLNAKCCSAHCTSFSKHVYTTHKTLHMAQRHRRHDLKHLLRPRGHPSWGEKRQATFAQAAKAPASNR
jgi:hypothetical protein